ncbi:MAG: ribosome small subunit-dependent GTPase A [Holophagaceae bacterium]|nr:ribosome small subunit-dependent GTPase A [Holophagaceae bacterium]
MSQKKFRLGQSRTAQDLDSREHYLKERVVESKRRQIRAERLATEVEAHDPNSMLHLPDTAQWSHLPQATIKQRHSQWVDLLLEDGSEIRATLAGKLKGVKLVCGDRVHFSSSPIETMDDKLPGASVVAVLPRRSLLKRGGIDDREPWQLVCANADELWICAAVIDPPLRPGLLERAYVLSLDANMPLRIIVTKRDMASPKDSLPELDAIRDLEIPIIETSAKTGYGLDLLQGLLHNKVVVLLGHSGVGKSSLINTILPGIGLKIGAISKYGTGRQTTTSANWLPTPFGGAIVDTPGIRTLSVRGQSRELLGTVFPEFPPEWLEDPMALDPEDEELGLLYPERLLSLQRLWVEMATRNPNQNVYR